MAERFWAGEDDPFVPLTVKERQNAAQTALPLASPATCGPTVVDARSRPGLFKVHDCVPGLFLLGDSRALDRPLIGIVGTRSASPYGRDVASMFAQSLAAAGATVVSGGAIGIDAAAHEGALRSGGTTVAVLPCGADVDYPARHRELFSRIRTSGCVLSRFPLGCGLREHWLPWRNKTVAALCQGLIVVEAPDRSGSLMTAGFARDYGVPVFVVPGPVTGSGFKGSHALVRQGATLVDDPGQVIEALGLEPAALVARNDGRDVFESQVLEAVDALPRSAESIGDATGLPVSVVLHALTLLEMDGAVYRCTEGYARRA